MARILLTMILVYETASLVVMLMDLLWGDGGLWGIITIGCLIQIISLGVLFKGNLSASSYTTIAVYLGSTTLFATIGLGIRDYVIMTYPAIILFAGLTLERRGLIISLLLTLASLAWLILGEIYGWFVIPKIQAPSGYDLIISSLIVVVSAIAVYLLVSNVEYGLTKVWHELAHRQRAEESLQKNQQNLQALIENSDGSIWSVDSQYRLIIGNALYHQNVRASIGRELLDGENLLALDLPQASLDEWRGYYDRALQGEKFSVTTRTRFTPYLLDMEYHFNPIQGENGQITGVAVFGRDITERKRVENALIQSEQLFKSYIQHAPNIITIVDRENRINYLNQIEDGLSLSAFLGKYIFDGVSPEYREVLKNALDETRAKGQPISYITSVEMKDGVTWYENRAMVIEPQNPSSDVIIISANITDRKKMEEELRKSHEDFQRYFNMGTVGMAVTSAEKGWIEVNDRLCEIFGYSKEELTRLTWSDLTHPDDLDANLKLFNQMTVGDIDSFQMDKRYIRKDNSVVYTTMFTACHRNPDGTISHLLTSVIDITERKQAEEALNKSEMMYRLLAENISDVIWILDIDTRHFRYVSPSVERLRGFTPEEVLAQDVTAALSPASLKEVQQGLLIGIQAYQEGDHSFSVSEIEQPCKDGSTVWTETTTSFHLNEANGHMEVFGVSRDITERRHNEKLLKEVNQQLRIRVWEVEQLQEELREQAIRDPLTGLYNRRYMHDVFNQEFSRATRENYPVSVIMLDMDELKNLNDTYGHHIGDQALQSLAYQLQSMTRKEDLVCRYGGDEFIVILSKAFPKDATKRVEEWRAALDNRPLTIEGYEGVRVRFTAGIASFPIHGKSMEEILNYADVALYRAKAHGRNCTLVFE